MQRWRIAPVTMGLHDDLYILIERHQESQESFY
jgi:hypothetical protein